MVSGEVLVVVFFVLTKAVKSVAGRKVNFAIKNGGSRKTFYTGAIG